MTTLALENHFIEKADRCVMCGLCLPQCPTYTLAQHEAESPRGRISLIKALSQSELIADEICVTHLENCLLCRQCESVCPANVPFGYLMDTTRQVLFENKKTARTLPIWLAALASSHFLQNGLFFLLWVYHHSGLRTLLNKSRIWHRTSFSHWEATLPARLPWLKRRPTEKSDQPSTVALFTGCLGKALDSQTLLASTRLLEAAGYQVTIPAKQVCCGALYQHAGDKQRNQTLLDKNSEAMKPFNTVISCASGCGLHLSEHQEKLPAEHQDIHSFLLKCADKLHFRPLNRTVLVHTPCTMQHMSRDIDPVTPLLKKIPGLKIQYLLSGCCGGAGAYMLTRQKTADIIVDNMINTVEKMEIDLLLTSNIGCALHFRRALSKHGLPIETLHPAVLLEQQLTG